MKIEIGELLVYSWLRHVKNCQIVQTNWKPSPRWYSNREVCKPILDLINPYLSSQNLDVFGGNSMKQLIAQAEIDVLGISDDHGDIGLKYYFVDIAFHEGGLNYGDKSETITRVLKKFIRTFLIYLSYFNKANPSSILFVSPKVSVNNIVAPITEHINKLTDLLKNAGYHPEFGLIVNDSFKEQILEPTIRIANEVADSSELFMRSYQLLHLFTNNKVTTLQNPDRVVDGQKKMDQPRKQNDFRKIHRISRWAEHPEQINHKMIKAFLYLENSDQKVSLENLQQLCSKENTSYYIKKFMGNFNSMRTDDGSSHGKVFYIKNGYVCMYDQVREVVNECFR